jgi:hypothetical protein
MPFILSEQRHAGVGAAFQRYWEYLERSRRDFPRSAYSLATSAWYYNADDHRCPHDAWLEEVVLSETASGARHEERSTTLRIRLLSAHHDGHIELSYPKVLRYRLELDPAVAGHRDWRYDEFRLTEDGNVLHEIEWWSTSAIGHWVIEASDVEFAWKPPSSGAGCLTRQ